MDGSNLSLLIRQTIVRNVLSIVPTDQKALSLFNLEDLLEMKCHHFSD